METFIKKGNPYPFVRGMIINNNSVQHNNQMAYGKCFYLTASGKTEIHGDLSVFEVDPKTLGVFVGTFKGQPFYEGDIIHLKTQNINKDFGIVTWHKNGYFFVDDSFGQMTKGIVNPIFDFFESLDYEFMGSIEITANGNIHQNPEILKQPYEKTYIDGIINQ